MDTTALEALERRRLLTAVAAAETPPAPVETAIVRGNVFRDANGNGLRESTETGQASVRVYLDYNNNGIRDGDAETMVITNSLGSFRFETANAPATIPVRLLLTGTNLTQTRPAANAARVVTTVAGGNTEIESFGVQETPTPPPPPAATVLTGIVYTDLNRSGARDSNEAGRANVSIFIDTNTNGTREDGEPIAITNGEGRYRFESVTTGTNVLRLLLTGTNLEQTQPAANGAVVATVVDGTTNQADAFGVAEKIVVPPPPPPAATVLTGIVYTDLNRSGARDSNEVGRANVSVFIDTNTNGTREDGEPIAITNGEGRYRFESVTPGSKTLRLLLTGTNLEQTQPTANGAVIATVVDGTTNQADAFGVAEKIVVPPAATVLTGIVYTDLNRNHVRDGNEIGRANVKVYIDLNTNGTREEGEPLATTNAEGRYRFETVTPGSTTLRLMLTGTNLEQTQPVNGQPVVTNVLASQVNQADAFGVAEKIITPPPVTTAIISGNVFYDTNQDATRQSSEIGRANVRVYLDLNNNAKRDDGEPNLLTNSAGHYQFDAAPARNDLHIRLDLTGTPLKQTLPTNNASRVLATVAGHTYADQNFGVHEVVVTPPPVTTGTIRGRVFNDVNHDGKQEAGDLGVPNRIVYLDTNHSGFLESTDVQATTNASGNYVFENVPAGTYIVRLRRGDLTQTSPSAYGAYTAVVTAGGTVGDLFFGTYKTPAATPAKAVVATKRTFNISDIIA